MVEPNQVKQQSVNELGACNIDCKIWVWSTITLFTIALPSLAIRHGWDKLKTSEAMVKTATIRHEQSDNDNRMADLWQDGEDCSNVQKNMELCTHYYPSCHDNRRSCNGIKPSHSQHGCPYCCCNEYYSDEIYSQFSRRMTLAPIYLLRQLSWIQTKHDLHWTWKIQMLFSHRVFPQGTPNIAPNQFKKPYFAWYCSTKAYLLVSMFTFLHPDQFRGI